ncbi:MAG: FecR domain-containing protein [Chitinophagaceae bacterium]
MNARITELCDKCLNQTATDAERQELLQLLTTPGFEEEAMLLLQQAFQRNKDIQPLSQTTVDDILSSVLQGATAARTPQAEANTKVRSSYIQFRRWSWAAAAAIIVAVAGIYWYQQNNKTLDAHKTVADVQPGKEGAVLTLANGTEVVLDSLGNGLVTTQNGSKVMLQDGKLAYDADSAAAEEIVYNTMRTPRGRQFNITLSDGTRVWLNAASSLKYPAVFGTDKRQVEVTGEAYFEVAKDKTRPFLVNINNKVTARVLGTVFNVNAYDEESSVNTTLLEGSLKVTAADEVILIPGQQAKVEHTAGANTNGKIAVAKADLDKVMAWRNGRFYFEGVTLQEAMLQLSRWYDIDVEYDKAIYEKDLQNTLLAGEIRRDLTLANVLDLLKVLGLHFRIEEKKLIVLP